MVCGVGSASLSTMGGAVKASVIVRFAERAGARTWLTSGLHPIYCQYSPGGFARRAFSIPQQRGWRVRVRVYVDGFNLYYGALKARPESRWLDLVAVSRLLRPNDAIDAIRYFTARVKGNRDATAPGKQKLYLAALDTLPLVTVHFGQFRTHPVAMPLAEPVSGRKRTARVLKTEEKGSDVNLATHSSWMASTVSMRRPWSSPMTPTSRLRSEKRTVASAPSTS